MFKKYRRRFILYALLSIFALLFVILGTINVVNYSFVTNDADRITKELANNGGSFDTQMPENPEDKPEKMGPDSPETKFSTRYFTVRVHIDNQTAEMMYYHISPDSLTIEQCLDMARDIAKSNKTTGWSKRVYRYRQYHNNKDKDINFEYISVIDQSREILPLTRMGYASIIGLVAGTAISFVVLFFVSKKLFKPLEDSNRKQKRFISDASHELKTPLAVISTNTEIIELDRGDSEESRVIKKEVRRLINTIDNLTTLAKLDETSPDKLDRETFSISDLVKGVSEKYSQEFTKIHKKLIINVDDNIMFNGDQDKMWQLITILLDNSLKYSVSECKLSLFKNNERIILQEDNDANDIKDGPLDTVFERFYRFEQDRVGSVEGSGLGLSTAKEIVKLHNGRIYAKGEQGRFIIKVEL